MFVLVFAACVAPTTVGIHTDGYLDPAGTFDVSAGFGSTLPGLDVSGAAPIRVGGGLVGVSVTDEVRLAVGAAASGALVAPQAEAMVRVIGNQESPLAVSAFGGLSALIDTQSAGTRPIGVRVGAVVSYEFIPDLRPFAGVSGNVDFTGQEVGLFSDVSAGATWRPALSETVGLLLLGELTWLHGEGARDADWNYDLLAGSGLVGITVNPKRVER